MLDPVKSHSQLGLGVNSYDDLAAAVTKRIARDRERALQQLAEVDAAAQKLDEKQAQLEELQRRIAAMTDSVDDVVELNVGGEPVSTSRAVLCSAQGSLLAGMFSGNFDAGLKRDKDNRVFLDVDPPLFSKLLSHLRLRRIESPDCPAPLPRIPEELRPEYDMMVKYFGLEFFMYGDVESSGNICQMMAELAGVGQAKLQTNELLRVVLSSTGGIPCTNHEEVFSPTGFHERSLENSYGAHPNTITVKFLKHRVRVEGMELRAKLADIMAHMSNHWVFHHGDKTVNMEFNFTREKPSTGHLEVTGVGTAFTDEIMWTFQRDFCLEHIVLYGHVMGKDRLV
mmetsp:Transcript_46995/g.132585  ORF Transcript_46995/g.132585 Transcript_46995/m.132585 type:complete len:340 (+) Transcript_46995:199-1218(+)